MDVRINSPHINHEISIGLLSIVNSHADPFVIIDRNYSILAVNHAYEKTYGISAEQAIGKKCYQISHGKTRPCNLEGEECPHQKVFNTGNACNCAHTHCGKDHQLHEVKISAYPLEGIDGELFMGECIEEIASHRDNINCIKRMVGNTPVFKALTDQLMIAASSNAPVLLQGETGTGKELAAEYIHQHSVRESKPFQIVDCTVFTDTLFESEMFGHASGAYTGSIGEKQGLIELADGGTLFLDEIGDLPGSQQAKLLRVLESGEYRRVGGKQTRKANVRIICATNRHLYESVLDGSFREDLYYRIACLSIRIPCLRERIDDIPVLARRLLKDISTSMHRRYDITTDAIDCLRQYQYPGNIRELRNILFIASTQCRNFTIDVSLIENAIASLPQCGTPDITDHQGTHHSLPPQTSNVLVDDTGPDSHIEDSSSGSATLDELEAAYIKKLLLKNNGNRKKTAIELGVSERTIYRKIKNLGINGYA